MSPAADVGAAWVRQHLGLYWRGNLLTHPLLPQAHCPLLSTTTTRTTRPHRPMWLTHLHQAGFLAALPASTAVPKRSVTTRQSTMCTVATRLPSRPWLRGIMARTPSHQHLHPCRANTSVMMRVAPVGVPHEEGHPWANRPWGCQHSAQPSSRPMLCRPLHPRATPPLPSPRPPRRQPHYPRCIRCRLRVKAASHLCLRRQLLVSAYGRKDAVASHRPVGSCPSLVHHQAPWAHARARLSRIPSTLRPSRPPPR